MGNELYYTPGVLEDLQAGKAATLGGTDYVLIEFSTEAEYQEIYNGLRTFVTAGYRPILAHTERYQALQKELERVRELVENGVYVQINARSFLGGRFDKRSDCHNCETRTPVMQAAVDKLLSCGTEEAVKRIVQTNVIQMAQNKYI